MYVKFYMDVHVPLAITNGLRLRGVDVLTAQEDDATRLTDENLLNRATQYNRVLVSFDDDLLADAAFRQRENISFSGVIYGHQLIISIGSCVKDLEIIAKVANPSDLKNKTEYLPL